MGCLVCMPKSNPAACCYLHPTQRPQATRWGRRKPAHGRRGGMAWWHQLQCVPYLCVPPVPPLHQPATASRATCTHKERAHDRSHPGGMKLGKGGESTKAITLDSMGLNNVSFIKVCPALGLRGACFSFGSCELDHAPMQGRAPTSPRWLAARALPLLPTNRCPGGRAAYDLWRAGESTPQL